MIYLNSFTLPSEKKELDYFYPTPEEKDRRLREGDYKMGTTTHISSYPFCIFRYRNMPKIDFEPITILYGGNGSGKSTILNVIAEKLKLRRSTVYNRTEFFDDYVSLCRCEKGDIPAESRMVTSDDVFEYLLDIRRINEGIDTRKDALADEYAEIKGDMKSGNGFRMESLDDYQALKQRLDVSGKTMSQYIKSRLRENIPEFSNGESALKYFTNGIRDNALYLLDEPENSLSPEFQLDLKQFLEDSARFFSCQFIIATHSPFLLAMKGAAVYDLDSEPPCVRRWTELENVRRYYRFFKEHEEELE